MLWPSCISNIFLVTINKKESSVGLDVIYWRSRLFSLETSAQYCLSDGRLLLGVGCMGGRLCPLLPPTSSLVNLRRNSSPFLMVRPASAIGLNGVEKSEVLSRHSLPVSLISRGPPDQHPAPPAIWSQADPVTFTKIVLSTPPDHSPPSWPVN